MQYSRHYQYNNDNRKHEDYDQKTVITSQRLSNGTNNSLDLTV